MQYVYKSKCDRLRATTDLVYIEDRVLHIVDFKTNGFVFNSTKETNLNYNIQLHTQYICVTDEIDPNLYDDVVLELAFLNPNTGLSIKQIPLSDILITGILNVADFVKDCKSMTEDEVFSKYFLEETESKEDYKEHAEIKRTELFNNLEKFIPRKSQA